MLMYNSVVKIGRKPCQGSEAVNPQMPPKRRRRSVTPADSHRWFEAHDRGESLAQIARREDRDQRTIRKGIASVQAGLETTAARRDAMRDALKEHFRRLIDDVAVLGRRAALNSPPEQPCPDP